MKIKTNIIVFFAGMAVMLLGAFAVWQFGLFGLDARHGSTAEIGLSPDDRHEADAHGEEDALAGHEADALDGHEGEDAVQLTAEEEKDLGIEPAVAGPGRLPIEVSIPGEIAVNADRLAHIVPRAPGIVRDVVKNIGDRVSAGEAMAFIESAELGEAKVDYLTRKHRLALARTDLTRLLAVHDNTTRLLGMLKASPPLDDLHKLGEAEMGDHRYSLVAAYTELVNARTAYLREKTLFEKQIASEGDLLEADGAYKKAEALYLAAIDSISFDIGRELMEAERALQIAEFEAKASARHLLLLGLTDGDVHDLEAGRIDDDMLACYALRAPFDGTVIEKDITLGERLDSDANVFVVADLSSVWADLSVYQRDLPRVAKGQSAVISAGPDLPGAGGVIAFVAPIVSEETRTALARVVLPNPGGIWRPGLFVTATVTVGIVDVPVAVPKSAVVTLDEGPVVFVKDEDGYEPHPVTLGRSTATHVEIVAGLNAGEIYVAAGAFGLKAKIVTSSLGSHAGHGH